MNYMFLICADDTTTPEAGEVMSRETPGWVEEMDARGVRLFGHQLEGPETALSVSVRDGQTLVTDGPFAETKEFIAGFDLIECDDLDEAIKVASTHPISWFHSIEVRRILGPDGSTEMALPDRELLAGPTPGHQRYLFLVAVNGIPEAEEEEAQIRAGAENWWELADRAGVRVFGQGLDHANTATTVRVREGETILTDGPFVESKEFAAGFAVIDLLSKEEAIALAAANPIARYHHIEVWPFARYPFNND
jgi:hypothetical protein